MPMPVTRGVENGETAVVQGDVWEEEEELGIVRQRARVARELWFLREQARVQAAEREFLQRLHQVIERAYMSIRGPGRVRAEARWAEGVEVMGEGETRREETLASSLWDNPQYREVMQGWQEERERESGARRDVNGGGGRNSLWENPQYRQVLQSWQEEQLYTRPVERQDAGIDILRELSAVSNSPFRNPPDSVTNFRDTVYNRESSWGSTLAGQANVSNVLESPFRHELEGILIAGRAAARGEGPTLSAPLRREGDEMGGVFAEQMEGQEGYIERENDIASEMMPVQSRSSRDRTLYNAIKALEREVAVLKNAISASFDMQIDIQRSIRQEVAACMNSMGKFSDGSGGEAAKRSMMNNNNVRSKPANKGSCLVCFETPIDAVLYTCGHMCVCSLCARSLLASGQSCPMCRAPVRDVIRVYEVLAD